MIGQTIATLSQIGRLGREPTVQAAAVIASAPAASAGLHAIGVSTDLDSQALAIGLVDPNLWFVLALAALFGALGGLVAELLSLHGNIERPHRVKSLHAKRTRLAEPRDMVDLGVFSRMLLGAAAALAVLSIYTPTTATALLVNSLIAGSAGTAVFRLVQARMVGSSSKQNTGRGVRPVSITEKAA
jgi:hypothetical protein